MDTAKLTLSTSSLGMNSRLFRAHSNKRRCNQHKRKDEEDFEFPTLRKTARKTTLEQPTDLNLENQFSLLPNVIIKQASVSEASFCLKEYLKGISCLLKMSFILKIFLLTLRTSSAIVEGVGLILQNVCNIVESTFKTDRFSTTVTKNKGTQTHHQATQSIPDLFNLKPCILISNLSSTQQVTITYEDGDNSLTIPLPTKSATSEVQPIGNQLDRCDRSKPPSQTVNLHSEIPAAADNSNILQRSTIHDFEDSKIQTGMGKSTTLEGSVRNICSITNNKMSYVKGTKYPSGSFAFSSDKEADGLGEHVPLAHSCSGSVDALRPRKSPSTVKHLHDKPLRELHGKTTGIKRKHLKNNGLDNFTASPTPEEDEMVVHHIPLTQLNLERTALPDSNTSSSRNLEHISSIELKSLTEIPPPYSTDSFIDVKSSLTCIDRLNSANLCQGFFCKNELAILSNPNSNFEDDSTLRVDSYNVKMNQNNVDCRPPLNLQMDGRKELIREWPLTPLPRDVSSSSVKEFTSRAENVLLVSKPSVERVKMHNIVHRNDSGKTEKTSVAETERSSEEHQYQMIITQCKKQTDNETKVKVIEEDKNSELEALNSSGEEYIKFLWERMSKIMVENEHKLKNLSNSTEEVDESSGEDLPTDETNNNESSKDSTDMDDNDAEDVEKILIIKRKPLKKYILFKAVLSEGRCKMEYETQDNYQSSFENATPSQNYPHAPQTSPINLCTKSNFENDHLKKLLTDVAVNLSKRDEETGEISRFESDADFCLLDSVESRRKNSIKSKNSTPDEGSDTDNKDWKRNSTESLPNMDRFSLKSGRKINSQLFPSDVPPEILDGLQGLKINKQDSNFISKLKNSLSDDESIISNLASSFSEFSIDGREYATSDNNGKSTDHQINSALLAEDVPKLFERLDIKKSQNKKRSLSVEKDDCFASSRSKKVTKKDFTRLLKLKRTKI
ncbi:hypothetical protein TNIN_325661 [Trichonephila inaurata madagascariensis]|uniref:Uncharacterized protein n=1 Tax=Trichonephila inaurata madagascariensis TaxID=2747483 RepID=A0A8X6Y892_9ARAC|nr:hypothetical protein TNIN_325661 [Trichonephila inaurata madagascariensis]